MTILAGERGAWHPMLEDDDLNAMEQVSPFLVSLTQVY